MKHITKNHSCYSIFYFLYSIFHKKRGFVLLDILISIAIISIVFITIVSIGTMSLNISSLITNTNQADSLIKEEIESLRSFRDGTDWFVNGLGTVNKGINNPYHIFLDTSSNPNKWNLAQGTETTGIFTRQIVFDNVSRDPATNNIEDNYNQSHNDPDTIKVTVTVAWPNKTSKVIMYLTNWHE